MMLRIHGSPRSRAVRTLWMAAELGLDYESNAVMPRAPETRSAAFLALNPTGQVPVIEDDGFVLSESMAINFYLAKKHNSPLYPADPHHEALAWQWSLWETDRLDRQIVTYANHSLVLPEAERDPAIAKAAWKDVGPAFDVLEATLGRGAWLAGPAFSVADLNVASAMYRALSMDLAKWPRMHTWLHACWDRPAAKKARALREA
jgi:glutathione S-transferase